MPRFFRGPGWDQAVLSCLLPDGASACALVTFSQGWSIHMLRSGSKFAWLLGAIILAWPPTAFAGELSVEIVGAEGPKGEIYVALFDKPELFPKTPLVTKRALAEGGKVVAIFRDVPAGAYAASAFLDENANSVLDRNL